MTKLRIAGLAAATVLVGLIIVAAACNTSGNEPLSEAEPLTEAELMAEREASKQALIDGALEGRWLYIKWEVYMLNHGGPFDRPDLTIEESWLGANGEGLLTTVVTKTSTQDGRPLQHTRRADGTMSITEVTTGETFEHPSPGSQRFDDYLNTYWQMAENLIGAGFTDKFEGTYNGLRSRVFERAITIPETSTDQSPGTRLAQFEIVESEPLYNRYSEYQEDASGARVLLTSRALTEYALLPEGSAPPRFG